MTSDLPRATAGGKRGTSSFLRAFTVGIPGESTLTPVFRKDDSRLLKGWLVIALHEKIWEAHWKKAIRLEYLGSDDLALW